MEPLHAVNGTARLYLGDCVEVMRGLPECSVDTVLCDPPYGLEFMGKEWDRLGACAEHPDDGEGPWGRTARVRYGASASSGQRWHEAWAREALRVAKPGALLLAFGGSRTYHRMACAVEDAGWEIRDQIMWVYGSGFPKSLDISKAIDKAKGAEREDAGPNPTYRRDQVAPVSWTTQRNPRLTAPATSLAREWSGYGTALKPAHEPIVVAMKPLDGTFAENAERWGVAGLNVDGGRVGYASLDDGGDWERFRGAQSTATIRKNLDGGRGRVIQERVDNGKSPSGRWPANLIHDGSEEVEAGFPGEAQRFYYAAKASRSEREAGCEGGGDRPANHHPTVKPLALMRYLAKLTRTPTGGVVLDPFMGSGSTGAACALEGRQFIGIEREPEYMEIARRRIAHWAGEPVSADEPVGRRLAPTPGQVQASLFEATS